MQRQLLVVGVGQWRVLRRIRLRALAEAPDSFGSTWVREQGLTDVDWRQRAGSATPTLVLLEDGVPAAMGGVYLPPEDPAGNAVLWGMWTAPEARGRGYADRVLVELLTWCRRQAVPAVELHVTEGNDTARRLYLDRDFTPTGEWTPLREGSELRVETLRRELSPLAL